MTRSLRLKIVVEVINTRAGAEQLIGGNVAYVNRSHSTKTNLDRDFGCFRLALRLFTANFDFSYRHLPIRFIGKTAIKRQKPIDNHSLAALFNRGQRFQKPRE